MIKKVLIANRAEIALRIARTCKDLGIECATLHTSSEQDLPQVWAADESHCLGDGELGETYLNQESILQIARRCKACAIHPGYGFLSENAGFAQAVVDAGLTFIGPPPAAIATMGDKKRAKELAAGLGIPLVPQYTEQKAQYPLLVKARAGGGGKGMRIVRHKKELAQALQAARREAQAAFGDGEVLLEKYLENPRHIEVQVFSDTHGGHCHLFERECSIQRRYQKILEESPAPNLEGNLREKLCAAAVKIAAAIDYTGAGTVEFILDEDDNFYFLEMNTRLQVEHPVTEMVTGLDLVALQIAVASGEELPFKQGGLSCRGHAIEARLCAEDPDQDFLPTGGSIAYVGRPGNPFVRLDAGYVDGNTVGSSFDSLLAKLIAWGEDRDQATKRLERALFEVPFLGIKTNRDYLVRIVQHPAFCAGRLHTGFVQRHARKLAAQELPPEVRALAVAAFLQEGPGALAGGEDAWEKLTGFRNA